MIPQDFVSDSAGRVVKTLAGYWAFIPKPLPPAIEYDPALTLNLSQADAALSELSGLGRYLPNPDLLIALYDKREAVASSRIEGTQADMSDLLLDEIAPKHTPPDSDVKEVANYVATKTIHILEECGMFKQRTGSAWGRVWVAPPILKAVQSGEPINPVGTG